MIFYADGSGESNSEMLECHSRNLGPSIAVLSETVFFEGQNELRDLFSERTANRRKLSKWANLNLIFFFSSGFDLGSAVRRQSSEPCSHFIQQTHPVKQPQEQRMRMHCTGNKSSFLINERRNRTMCLVPWIEEYNCLDLV